MFIMQQIALTSEVPSSIMLHKVVDRYVTTIHCKLIYTC